MTNTNEEMDLDEMSIDELDKLLDQKENEQSETSEEVTSDSEQVDQTSTTTEIDESDAQPEDSETETQEQNEQTLEGDDIPEHYRGKSARDLLEMQQNATRKISRQEHELWNLKKDLELAKQQLNSYQQPQLSKQQEDDILADYDKKDIEAIRKILRTQIIEMEQEKAAKYEQEKQSAINENEQAWSLLKGIDPDFFTKIEKDIVKAVEVNPDATYHKRGWLQGFVAQKKAELSNVKKQDKTAIKRRAVTVTSSGNSNSVQSIKKPVDEMTSTEFLEYSKAQGLKI